MTDTTAATQAKKLNQVRALLAKAEAEGCTREEAEALTAKAAELMAKYGIERAMLAAEDPRSDELADFQFDVEGAYTDATATLIHGIAKAFRCQTIQLSGTRGGRMHIFGFKSDLERVEIMFTSLDLQMVNALLHDVPDGTANIDSVSRGYCFAYASAVVARLQERERVAAARRSRRPRARSWSWSAAKTRCGTVSAPRTPARGLPGPAGMARRPARRTPRPSGRTWAARACAARPGLPSAEPAGLRAPTPPPGAGGSRHVRGLCPIARLQPGHGPGLCLATARGLCAGLPAGQLATARGSARSRPGGSLLACQLVNWPRLGGSVPAGRGLWSARGLSAGRPRPGLCGALAGRRVGPGLCAREASSRLCGLGAG